MELGENCGFHLGMTHEKILKVKCNFILTPYNPYLNSFSYQVIDLRITPELLDQVKKAIFPREVSFHPRRLKKALRVDPAKLNQEGHPKVEDEQ